MHFDPIGSEDTPAADIRDFSPEDMLARQVQLKRQNDRTGAIAGERQSLGMEGEDTEDREDDREDEDDEESLKAPRPGRGPREGLPARFRMRHTPHYVDELLGDAPPRTVRQIPVSEIEAPVDDQAALEDLERSIGRLGIIEPLLVGRRGGSYRVIAGMRRLRAAQRLGLDTVPCLVHEVHEVNDERLTDMRDAATQRLVIPPPPPEEPETIEAPASSPETPLGALGEAALGLEFVSALLPAMNAAGSDRLRWGVLTDLAAVELARTKAIGAAHEGLRRGSALERTTVDPGMLISDVVAAVATEARLRAVRVSLSVDPAGLQPRRDIFVDAGRCRDALTGLLHCLLTLAPRAGTAIVLTAQITSIRPAFIVEGLIEETDPELSPEALARFFDAGWREHPCGPNGGAILAALAQAARAHGGRVEVKPAAMGCVVTFVVPQVEG